MADTRIINLTYEPTPTGQTTFAVDNASYTDAHKTTLDDIKDYISDAISGTTGSSGTSGTSGADGSDGTDGTSGTSGVDGSDGTDGTSGTSGTDGYFSGTSGKGINDSYWPSVIQVDIDDNTLKFSGDTIYVNDIYQPHENGFINRTDSDISFDETTRVFTIQPTGSTYFEFYNNYNRYKKTSTETVTITDEEGIHFIYYSGSTLSTSTTAVSIQTLIETETLVAFIYWDYTNKKVLGFGDERHGCIMSSDTHLYNHETYGARYQDGLGLYDMDVDGDGDDASAAQFSVNNGHIWDEDIQHTITDDSPQQLSVAQIPIFYLTGTTKTLRKIDATDYPITTTGTGRAAYNNENGGDWTISEVTNLDFCLMHYYATNDKNHPIIAFMGQNVYTTAGAARAGAYDEIFDLNFGILSQLTPEFVAIATVIFQSGDGYDNDVKSRVRSTDEGDDYIDWRRAKGGGGTSSSDGTDGTSGTSGTDGTSGVDGSSISLTGNSYDVLYVDSGQTGGYNAESGLTWDQTNKRLKPLNIDLQNTEYDNINGIIYKNGKRFIHDFSRNPYTNAANIYIGEDAGNITLTGTTTTNAEGIRNIGIGFNSLNKISTGYENIAIGDNAMYVFSGDGQNNVGVGSNVFLSLENGNINTAIGSRALENLITGGTNTAIGYGAGRYYGNAYDDLTYSNDGIFIGGSSALNNNSQKEIIIGNIIGNGSNTTTIGNDDTTDTYLRGRLNIDDQIKLSSGTTYDEGEIRYKDNSLWVNTGGTTNDWVELGTGSGSGTSGTSGVDGIDGTDGTSGVDGADGTDGSSGTSGVDGTTSYSFWASDSNDDYRINNDGIYEIVGSGRLATQITGSTTGATLTISNAAEGKVQNVGTDTLDYLGNKLEAGTDISFSYTTGSEKLQINYDGTNTFVGLTDTPSTYTANNYLKVNSGATALEFTTDVDTGLVYKDGSSGNKGWYLFNDTRSNKSAIGNECVDFSTADTGTQGVVGYRSIIMGKNNLSGGYYSFTAGIDNLDYADGSITVGSGNTNGTSGDYSIILGKENDNNGYGSIISGWNNNITGHRNIVGGYDNTSGYNDCLLNGIGLETSNTGQAVFGTYNSSSSSNIIEVGNGTSDSARKNIFSVDTDGDVYADGTIQIGGTSDSASSSTVGRLRYVSGEDYSRLQVVMQMDSVDYIWYTIKEYTW